MLPCFVSCLLIPACVSWINPCLVVLTVCTLFGLLLMILDYPSSQALWKLFADQRPTLALELLFVLPVLYLFADVLTQPVFLTKSWNKACKLSRTSHVSFALLQNTQPHKDPAAFQRNIGQVWTPHTYYKLLNKARVRWRTIFKSI